MSHLDAMDLRVRALETVLTQKGYIDPAALDMLVDEQGFARSGPNLLFHPGSE
jgi:formate dehydrogenase maturation protein FdhE